MRFKNLKLAFFFFTLSLIINSGYSQDITIASGQTQYWEVSTNGGMFDYHDVGISPQPRNGNLDNVTIQYGGTLRIKGSINNPLILQFNGDKGITVQMGGHLFIDGVEMTTNSGNGWNGIVVQGAPVKQFLALPVPHFSTSGVFCQSVTYYYSGYFNSANSIIRNAKTGLEIQYSGVAYCFRTQFIHNGFGSDNSNKAIYIHDFIGYFYPEKNLTTFFECTFDIGKDGPSIIDNVPNEYKLVYIKNIKGIHFEGCTFKNLSCIGPPFFGIGIYSENSSIIVEKSDDFGTVACAPFGLECSFIKLNRGIYCQNNDQGTYKLISRDNIFQTVYKPIYLSHDDGSIIYKNDMNYDQNSNTPEFINSNYSNNISILENTIKVSVGCCGMGGDDHYIMFNEPSGINKIYKTFINKAFGCNDKHANGICISSSALAPHDINFDIRCNDFMLISASTDFNLYNTIWINAPHSNLYNNLNEINKIGNSQKSACNLFDNSGDRKIQFDLNFNTQSNISYYFDVNESLTLDNLQSPYPSTVILTPPTQDKVYNNVYLDGGTTMANTCPNTDVCLIWGRIPLWYATPPSNFTFKDVGNLTIHKKEGVVNFLTLSETDSCDLFVVPDSIEGNETPDIDIPYKKVQMSLSPNPTFNNINVNLSSDIIFYNDYTITIKDVNNNVKFTNVYNNTDTNIVINRNSIGGAGTYYCSVSPNEVFDTTIAFQIQDSLNVTVYPNPSDGDVNISLTGLEENSNYTVLIYDQYNNLVYNNNYNSNFNPIMISRSYINNGIAGTYTLAITHNNCVIYSTFVLLQL